MSQIKRKENKADSLDKISLEDRKGVSMNDGALKARLYSKPDIQIRQGISYYKHKTPVQAKKVTTK